MLPPPKYQNNLASGTVFMSEGIKLLWHPKLRLYILVPLLVNIVLFILLTSAFVGYISGILDSSEGFSLNFPSWLAWLEWVLEKLAIILKPLAWLAWVLLGIIILIIYAYSFNIITNIIAAPFYGMLATKAEEVLTGKAPPEEPLTKMVPRVIARELSKLMYFITRGLAIMLVMIFLGTIPLIGFISPLIGLAWGAWSMAIQYADYPADNHQLGFKALRKCLWRKKFSSLGFGGFIMLCTLVPIVNIFVMPAAVTGGTIFWLRELKGCRNENCDIKGFES